MGMQVRRPFRGLSLVFLAWAALIGADPAAAQSSRPTAIDVPQVALGSLRFGIGYAANAPHQLLGFSGYVLSSRWQGIGLYVDAKFDLESPRDDPLFIDSLTARRVDEEFGDSFFSSEESWTSFSAALIRPFTDQFMAYLGAGYGQRESFIKYQDPSGDRGVSGFYIVEDTDVDGGAVRFLGGGFFRIFPSIHIQLGLETSPNGGTVGVAYTLPF